MIAYWGLGWRVFAGCSAAPVFLAFILTYLFLPESCVFLLEKGRLRECVTALSVMTQRDCSDVLTLDDYDSQSKTPIGHRTQLLVEEGGSVYSPLDFKGSDSSSGSGDSCNNAADDNNGNGNCDMNYTISRENSGVVDTNSVKKELQRCLKSQLFQQPLRRHLIVVGTVWFLLSFGSYGISTWISTLFDDIGISDVYFASLVVALATLPVHLTLLLEYFYLFHLHSSDKESTRQGNVAAYIYIDTIGRCPLLIYGMVAASFTAIGTVLDKRKEWNEMK